VDVAIEAREARPLGGVIDRTADGAKREAEQALVRRAKDGDVTAFEQLYRDNERRVFALCLRMSSNPSLAEEITQDVFVRAWRKLSSFRGDSAFSSWLHPIAVNTALSERRARVRRTSRVFATDDLTPFEKAPETKQAGAEAGFDLEAAMRELPPGARAVFVLHDVEGYRHEEIARTMGIAVGTSKAQLHRARALLREALKR
jgi:RNA polymerase sigma-70 factor (ECF subfamily)